MAAKLIFFSEISKQIRQVVFKKHHVAGICAGECPLRRVVEVLGDVDFFGRELFFDESVVYRGGLFLSHQNRKIHAVRYLLAELFVVEILLVAEFDDAWGDYKTELSKLTSI